MLRCKWLLRLETRQDEKGSLCMKLHEALCTCLCTCVWVRVKCMCSHMIWVQGSALHLFPCAFLCLSACEFYMRAERVCTCHRERNVPQECEGPRVCLSSVVCVMHVPVSWCPLLSRSASSAPGQEATEQVCGKGLRKCAGLSKGACPLLPSSRSKELGQRGGGRVMR